jgi:leucyl/phenylalanyl-tRNA--protein transferase
MFSRRTDASKAALLGLARLLRAWGWPLIDAQVASAHLYTLGGAEMARAEFAAEVARLSAMPGRPGPWIGAADGLDPADF